MKFLVELDDLYAEAYKKMAKERGFGTRQALVRYILEESMNQYPHVLERVLIDAMVKAQMREESKPWNPKLAPPPADVMEEIFGDDLDKYGSLGTT